MPRPLAHHQSQCDIGFQTQGHSCGPRIPRAPPYQIDGLGAGPHGHFQKQAAFGEKIAVGNDRGRRTINPVGVENPAFFGACSDPSQAHGSGNLLLQGLGLISLSKDWVVCGPGMKSTTMNVASYVSVPAIASKSASPSAPPELVLVSLFWFA